MKAKGRPFGQAFGHTVNDPNAWAYPILWMWGGQEVQRDGKTVTLESKGSVEAVKFTVSLWKDVFDEGGLAWDDSNNNRAYLSQEISLTGNAPSIYVAARQKFPDVYKGTNHGHYPPGPNGRFYWLPCYNSCVMKYSKNQKLAKDFIHFYMDRARFEPYFETMDTFGIPGTKAFGDHALWKKDPKTAVENVYKDWLRIYGSNGQLTLYRPPENNKCERCGGSGFKGRLGLHELLVATDALKKLIQEHARVSEIVAVALEEGMHTLKQDGIEKVLTGLTHIKEVRAVCIK